MAASTPAPFPPRPGRAGAKAGGARPAAGSLLTRYRTEFQLALTVLVAMLIALYSKPARPAVAVAMGVVFIVLAFKRLDLALCMLMFYIVAPPLIETKSILGVPGLNPETVMTVILLLATLQRSQASRGASQRPGVAREKGNPMTLPLLVFIAITATSTVISSLRSGTPIQLLLPDAKQFLMFSLLVFVVAAGLKSEREATTVFIGFLAALGFLVSFASRDIVTHLSNPRFRLDTFIGQPNEFGGFMAMYAPLVLTALLAPKLRLVHRIALAGLAFGCGLSLIFTLSRGSMLGILAGLATIGGIYSRKFLIVVLLAAALHSYWLPQRVMDRFEETKAEEEGKQTEFGVDASTAVRMKQWQGIPQMVRGGLWLGQGFGRFPYIYRGRISGKLKGAHSSWVQLLVEEGVLGLFSMLWIMATIAWMAWRVMRGGKGFLAHTVGPGMLACVAVCLVVNSAGARLHNPTINAYLWILTGLLVFVYRSAAAQPASRLQAAEGGAGWPPGRPSAGRPSAGFFVRRQPHLSPDRSSGRPPGIVAAPPDRRE